MIGAFVQHFIPFPVRGDTSAYRVISEIVRDLDATPVLPALEYWKPNLYSLLRWRFDQTVAQALTLKTLNTLLARRQLRRRSSTLLSHPIGLVVDPSNVCQLACPGCVHSARSESLPIFDWPKGTLAENCMTSLLRRYGPYAVGVYFCNYGEPLLNLRTPEFIRLAKTYLLQTALSTSMSVRKFDADAYVSSGLDCMVLSIDGASQKIYERFRRNGNLELALDNVRRIVAAKRRLGKQTPVLSWNFLAFQHNAHEIPTASQLAAKLGVDQFRVVNPFDVKWDDPDIRAANVGGGLKRCGWPSALSIAQNWNVFPKDLPAGQIAEAFREPWKHVVGNDAASEGDTCHWLYKNMAMDATGRIMPCCGAPGPDKDLVFAHFDQADPFNSEKYRRARSFFVRGKASPEDPYCARCEWVNSPVNIGGPEIRRYFRSADAAFFDRRSLKLLSDW